MFKKLFALSIVFILTFATQAYAGSLNVSNYNLPGDNKLPLTGFEITHGLSKDVETTFSTTRAFDGKAPKDSQVTVIVYQIDFENEFFDESDPALIEKSSYTLTVGPSGIFTQTVDLSIGENYIVVKAELENFESVKSTIIKRKAQDIMLKLEQQSIALPGASSITAKVTDDIAQGKVK